MLNLYGKYMGSLVWKIFLFCGLDMFIIFMDDFNNCNR